MPEFTTGDRLRKAREVTKLDRIHFAQAMGIHRESVARYESDKSTPSLPVLMMWATVTGVAIAWLTGADSIADSASERAAAR